MKTDLPSVDDRDSTAGFLVKVSEHLEVVVSLIRKIEAYASRYFSRNDPSALMCDFVVGTDGTLFSIPANLPRRIIAGYLNVVLPASATVTIYCYNSGTLIKTFTLGMATAAEFWTGNDTRVKIPLLIYCDQIKIVGSTAFQYLSVYSESPLPIT